MLALVKTVLMQLLGFSLICLAVIWSFLFLRCLVQDISSVALVSKRRPLWRLRKSDVLLIAARNFLEEAGRKPTVVELAGLIGKSAQQANGLVQDARRLYGPLVDEFVEIKRSAILRVGQPASSVLVGKRQLTFLRMMARKLNLPEEDLDGLFVALRARRLDQGPVVGSSNLSSPLRATARKLVRCGIIPVGSVDLTFRTQRKSNDASVLATARNHFEQVGSPIRVPELARKLHVSTATAYRYANILRNSRPDASTILPRPRKRRVT